MRASHAFDKFLFFEILNGLTGKGDIDTKTLRNNGRCDELAFGNFRHQLVVGGLIKNDGVVQFI